MIPKILMRLSSFVSGCALMSMAYVIGMTEYNRVLNYGYGLAAFAIFVCCLFFLLALPLILWPITPSKLWEKDR
jgi:hypothetical protein